MTIADDLNSLVRHAQANPSCSKETVLIRISKLALRLSKEEQPVRGARCLRCGATSEWIEGRGA
jgi:hypothetical protein